MFNIIIYAEWIYKNILHLPKIHLRRVLLVSDHFVYPERFAHLLDSSQRSLRRNRRILFLTLRAFPCAASVRLILINHEWVRIMCVVFLSVTKSFGRYVSILNVFAFTEHYTLRFHPLLIEQSPCWTLSTLLSRRVEVQIDIYRGRLRIDRAKNVARDPTHSWKTSVVLRHSLPRAHATSQILLGQSKRLVHILPSII